ncbi:sigma-70 family RNA polymerase sigma factor [Cellulomonas sp. URHD0024]|uniref:sigma-70 family RNA polymerase sigma factor n=1 Tax=Cellulomonas sp. URHD0024 TaxID=1302620 RepID=UPI0003F4FEF9|nr:sigma-70 family RNA polymerase sigma factor [Cellulomonas sp. URHD0024]
MTKQTPSVDDLVLANMPLVGYAVSELLHRVPPSVSRDELISAGSLALVLAARAYDPTTGVPFARYASLRIRGALVDELRSMDWATRGARQKVRELATTSERLTATLGRSPSREELAGALGTDVAAVDRASQDAARRVLSMDSSDVPVAELVRDGSPNPEEVLLSDERLRWLRAAVQTLPEKLRVVVDGIFLQDRSVADLADELGVTQSRISQLRTEALSLLKDGLNAGLDPDLVPAAERPEGVAERRRQKYFAAVAARAAMAPMAPPMAPHGIVPSPFPASADEAVRERAMAAQRAGEGHAYTA